VVKPDPNNPEPVEVIAAAIVAIYEGIKKLRAGPLNDRALLLLIQHATPGQVTAKQIRAVLNGIESLEEQYLKPKKK
jgi:hypothetical protein